jgi:hypothetical protein
MDEIDTILPSGVEITYDRNLLSPADVVVFNVPFLPVDLKDSDEIEKREGQIWVGWSYESEASYPWMFSEQLKELFDIRMTYHLDSDIVLPYYDYTFLEKLYTPPVEKTKDVCMFISSPVNESRRIEYLTELMKYIKIDSYGQFNHNCEIINDTGYKSKLDVIKNYKFTIAFENAISKDYVTEKFFDPLIMGSVPVYLGAPGIDTFSPGNNSFMDVRNYDFPKSLADAIKKLCKNDDLYHRYLEWKNQPLKNELQALIENQKVHPFVRLVNLVKSRKEHKK